MELKYLICIYNTNQILVYNPNGKVPIYQTTGWGNQNHRCQTPKTSQQIANIKSKVNLNQESKGEIKARLSDNQKVAKTKSEPHATGNQVLIPTNFQTDI